ncbi:class I SAM-dependent methyltransferase [Chondromyces apiculatus]|uniref:Methyltransferase domain-containing protein n=1 Tax=Chondromyces apiculatus DSM 436 TaxID=1192034 RepID=A0A017TDP6_9BACT|nr:class I SAM-dependent methyltransferase [Chondromyces apiculatus]EYF07369.1 Hypothetical protein CAP_0122 [Chondromyces apiculatus DSM 436]
MGEFDSDLEAIKRHYLERFLPTSPWASLINHQPYLYQRQRQRRLRETLLACGFGAAERLRDLKALDIGCGAGGNLAWLADLGADPANLTGIDLLEPRVDVARARFKGIRFLAGDIVETDVGGPYDLVMVLAVLTSVVNPAFKRRIMDKALSLLKRPGGILFVYDVITPRPVPGTPDYQCLTFDELDAYVAPHALRYFRRDLLKPRLANRLVPRYGVGVAEMVQALGVFNIDGAFAYART